MTLLAQLAIALGLGLLVGLQRERAAGVVAGIRTFPLIAILGVLSAALAEPFGGWLLAAAFLGLAAVVVVGNLTALRAAAAPDPGITTEVAAFVMFAVGAGLRIGYVVEAVVVSGGVAALLHWKEPMHRLADRIGEADFRAIIRFVLIALVILPVLPNRAFGPYGVLNPFEIWLMVVLIVGISLAAYVAHRLLGERGGTLAAGVLGGLISSTAATVGYARLPAASRAEAERAAVLVVLASTVVFVRVLGEIALVAPEILTDVGPPLTAMLLLMAGLSAAAYLRARPRLEEVDREEAPPSTLWAAILFGLLYAAVLFAVAFARSQLGRGGLFAVAGLSGLTDMDAITLSTAQLLKAGRLEPGVGWRMILVGAMANLVFKGIIVAALGGRRLASRVAILFGLSLAGGALVLVAWPG